ncbi:uncharacterized protein METZ01_LOCUS122976 [marine metagenome]|uniref:Uncharacterized protein n=1 Tax=marine metagenome TaxID=408172 RepID=A0A381Y0A3_9ZZZZ
MLNSLAVLVVVPIEPAVRLQVDAQAPPVGDERSDGALTGCWRAAQHQNLAVVHDPTAIGST